MIGKKAEAAAMGYEFDFRVPCLGECTIPSPIRLSTTVGDAVANYVGDEDCARHLVDATQQPLSMLNPR